MRGKIVKAIAGFYYVRCEKGIYAAKARGIFKNQGITPLVGDEVEMEITHEDDKEAVIDEIRPRKNSFIRPPVANVDLLAVVCAAADPQPNTDVIDRFLVMAESADTEIIICVSKIDIADRRDVEALTKIYKDLYPLYPVSGRSGEGIDALKDVLRGKQSAFAGASGVGKSTLLNALEPEAGAETGGISAKTKRGRHTTRHVEIFDTSFGGSVFDTPGFTSLEVAESDEAKLPFYFPEMRKYQGECRFDNCRHLKEPGCAIRRALEEGFIAKSRYDSYVSQLEAIRSVNAWERK